MFEVTKTIHWHMGHRVPNHKSKCRSMHGHTYKIEVTIEAEQVCAEQNTSDEGMVSDFSDIKQAIIENIYDDFDHATMLYSKDPLINAFLGDKNTRLIVIDMIPTAENIAQICYRRLEPILNCNGKTLKQVKIWETPTSTAAYRE